MISKIVTYSESNQRIDKYVKKLLNEAPLSLIYKLFRKKDVKVNKHWVKQEYVIKEGEEVTIYITDEQLKEFNKTKEIKKVALSHPIIYEDENILLINKPRGLLVHGDEHEKRITLANEVISYLYSKDEYNPKITNAFAPAPAHRLDRNTSGIVVFAKNLISLHELEELFKDKEEIVKTYSALVYGNLQGKYELDYPLKKDSNSGLVKVCPISQGGKSALSIVEDDKHYDDFTLVNVKLITGRTHQIRVHLSKFGYPVVGDAKYGNFKINKEIRDLYKFENQFLHARSLEFKNISGHLSYLSGKIFVAPLSAEEQRLLEMIKK